MEIIRETIEEKPYTSKVFAEYFGTDWCVLDIETTGLSPRTSKVILAGLAFPDGDRIRAVQLFAHSRGEEEELLLKLNSLLNRNLTIVTYNGASFDLPYLEYRCRANRVTPAWLPAPGLDLYRAVRSHSPLAGILPNLKQKSVEAYLGLAEERTDEISGAESVRLYEEYETFSNPEDREHILLHNRDDIVQLSRLMRILDKLDLHRIVYYEALSAPRTERRCGTGAAAGAGQNGENSAPDQSAVPAPFVVRKITPGRSEFAAEGVTDPASPDYYGFAGGYTFSLRSGKWKLSIPGETIDGYFAVNLREILTSDGAGAEEPLSEEPDGIPAAFRDSPHRAGDYLIVTGPGEIYFREANALIRAVLARI